MRCTANAPPRDAVLWAESENSAPGISGQNGHNVPVSRDVRLIAKPTRDSCPSKLASLTVTARRAPDSWPTRTPTEGNIHAPHCPTDGRHARPRQELCGLGRGCRRTGGSRRRQRSTDLGSYPPDWSPGRLTRGGTQPPLRSDHRASDRVRSAVQGAVDCGNPAPPDRSLRTDREGPAGQRTCPPPP